MTVNAQSAASNLTRAVVVFAGGRDNYQLPLALQEADLLAGFVTNVYSKKRVSTQYHVELDNKFVHVPLASLGAFGLMRLFRGLSLHHYSDRVLSTAARDLAYESQAALFAYSYYAFEAFKPHLKYLPHRFIFQLHPHPKSVRKILLEELDLVPAARNSLLREAELRLKAEQFKQLADEPHLANGWVAASSYTASTLAENGIERNRIHIVPYGVDLSTFVERKVRQTAKQPFTIMFLGGLVQRKGLSYLLDAVRLLHTNNITVLLRGRGYVDEELLAEYRDIELDIQLNLPTSQIVQDFHRSDMFVLPSIVEGFAHVVLQAMSCGLPVLTTINTSGPDLLVNERHGFVVPIRDSCAIADRIEWGIHHRAELFEMGHLASGVAKQFTWARFRQGVRHAYLQMLSATPPSG